MKIGAIVILAILISSLAAPLLTSYDPTQYDLAQKLQSPSSQHLLGTDGNGADIFSEILYGGRLSLKIAMVVVALSVSIGLIMGSLAGYYGKFTDQIIMRVIDMLVAFPGFLLALAIIA